MNFVLFIFILVALILVHELGHFIAAKWMRVKVEEFAIGFPPRIFKIKKGETTYSFNWLLFGGYVRLLGENETAKNKTSVGSPSVVRQAGSFAFASGWTQATITFAGVGMNFVFAWLAFVAVFMAGVQIDAAAATYPQYLSNRAVTIEAVAPDSPAESAGVMPGDVVRNARNSVDTLPQNFTSADFQQFTGNHQHADMLLTVMRGKEEKSLIVQPAEGLVPGRAAIGVELADLAVERLPPHLAAIEGTKSFYAATKAMVIGLASFFGSIITGRGNFADVAGPVGIAKMGAQSVSEGFSMGLLFAAIISINLALLNLLPIPGLDGGRLLFILIERAKGSALSPELATRITIAGFALLATLMIIVTYHDIARLI